MCDTNEKRIPDCLDELLRMDEGPLNILYDQSLTLYSALLIC